MNLQGNMVLGIGKHTKEYSWIDFSVGLGLSSVNFTPLNSNVIENRTASAFTFSLGSVIKPNQSVNVGVFVGWDFLSAKDRNVEWVYNNRMWIGLGFNVALSNIKTQTKINKKINSVF